MFSYFIFYRTHRGGLNISRVYLRLVAVSSRHNPVLSDQGTTTEVVPNIQRHLVGLGMSWALIPTDDLVIVCGNWKQSEIAISLLQYSKYKTVYKMWKSTSSTSAAPYSQAAPMSRTKTRENMLAVWCCQFFYLFYTCSKLPDWSSNRKSKKQNAKTLISEAGYSQTSNWKRFNLYVWNSWTIHRMCLFKAKW